MVVTAVIILTLQARSRRQRAVNNLPMGSSGVWITHPVSLTLQPVPLAITLPCLLAVKVRAQTAAAAYMELLLYASLCHALFTHFLNNSVRVVWLHSHFTEEESKG